MSKRVALGISAALTAFVVTILVVVAFRAGASGNPDVEAGALQESAQVALPATGITSEEAQARLNELEALNAALLEREETYRQRLDEANNLLRATTSVNGEGSINTEIPRSDGQKISRDRAVQIAKDYAGGGKVKEVELEEEHGELAYEVELQTDKGELEIYVDAYSGEVLYSKEDD